MGHYGSREARVPSAVTSKFTSIEMNMLRKSFDNLAQRSPGKVIDKETFLEFFPLPGLHGERLFQVFDHKGNGAIDYEEFITGLAICIRGTFEEKSTLIFQLYDVDNTNYISKDELRTMLVQIPRHALIVLCAASDSEQQGTALRDMLLSAHEDDGETAIVVANRLVEDAFSKFDLNHDDQLSKEQFRLWVENTPEVLNFLEASFLDHGTAGTGTSSEDGGSTCSSELRPSPPVTLGLVPPLRSAESSPCPSPSNAWKMVAAPAAPATPTGSRERHGSLGLLPFWRRGSEEDLDNASTGGESTSPRASQPGLTFTTTSEDVHKSGMLYKVGRRTKALMGRFFMLKDKVLYYYYPNKLEQPAGVIFLQKCFVTIVSSDTKGGEISSSNSSALRSKYSEVSIVKNKRSTGPADAFITTGPKLSVNHAGYFPFEIITSQGGERDSRVLYAKSEHERHAWVEAIKQASSVVPFQSKYQSLELVGKGKFAEVYKCEKLENVQVEEEEEGGGGQEKFYAVKIIDKGQLDAEERELLRVEIAVLKLVHHPNIISLHDVFESLNNIYLVLDFVQGGELFERIVGRSRLTEDQTYPVVKQLLDAVHYLHILGIAHRDIKPENILCSGTKEDPVWTSRLKICDFGLSKLISPQGVMKLACGTLSYVAPEVLSGVGYGRAADLWSIGVILYLVRRGCLPFEGDTKDEIIYKTKYAKLDFESDPVLSKSSPDFIHFLAGLLKKNPGHRLNAVAALAHPWMKRQAEKAESEKNC